MNPSLKTLIVDDDDVDRSLLKRLLSGSGLHCAVDEACDGDQALQCVGAEHYDCIFLDQRLPGQTGVELLPKLRERHGGELPVVMLAGAGDERPAVASLQGGAQHYLSKRALSVGSLRQAMALAIKRAARVESLQRQSVYDEVTGLANRSLFQDRIAQMTRTAERTGSATPFALLCMDLNRFKAVNDEHGHAAGDQALRAVAERLSVLLRESDTLARLGGDEFAAILPTTDSVQGAIAVAEKFVAAMRSPVEFDLQPLDVGLSVGIAMYPRDCTDAAGLVDCADQAMYEAKRSGAHYAVYGARGGAAAPAPATVDHYTLQFLDRLTLAFQPKIDLATGELRGVETLVRWLHPKLGLLPPTPLIPAAERPEITGALSYALIERAIRQADQWSRAGVSVTVAVNLSPCLLADARLTEKIAELLHDHALPPARLMLEISEPDLLRQPQATLNVLARVAALGVQLAIDGFATGYSSLQYLQAMPIAELKLDRVFVQAVAVAGDSLLLESITRLADERSAHVVAEGVDDATVAATLLQAGCRAGQGLLWCAPLPAERVIAFAAQHAPPAGAVAAAVSAAAFPSFAGAAAAPS